MMKKCTLGVFMLLSIASFAQIVPVSYRGAFAPAPTAMWTDGWANWDPQNAIYSNPTVTIDSTMSIGNTIWTANNVYLIKGPVKIDSLTSLRIEPGTIIRGDHTVPNSSIIVRRGGKLFAQGTATKPIVFTSNKAIGDRSPGDWGGIIILGRATTNATGNVAFIEGLRSTPESQYGGGLNPDDNDNSGILTYVRIEYGGYVFQPNVEINGLTLGAVGRGTTIHHIQCSFTNDDSFEWFGGNVNCSYLVAYRGVDDNWDTDNGFSGKVQFCLGVRDPNLYDVTFAAASNASTSEGFESDNDAGGSNNSPRTSAIFCNVTDIGPFRGTANPASDLLGFRRAGRIRRNSQLSIYNSILMDWRTGLFVDGSGSEGNFISGVARFRNNIIAGVRVDANGRNIVRTNGSAIANWAGIANIDSLSSTTGLLVTPYNFDAPDYRPAVGSAALNNYDFTDATISAFVENVNYRGAFAPAPTAMWTDGWANWDPQNVNYGAPTVTIDSTMNIGNTTWTANNVYLIKGPVKIDSLKSLRIEPGTVIRGDHTVPNSSIIVRRGGRLYAQGTATSPIVFTSNKAIGDRSPGDWGGIIMLGRATTNATGNVAFVEGLRSTPESQYGGGLNPDDNDNSGVLSYVRIEYGGYVFQPNVEINGLTFGAVGRGTTIDHVQCSFTNDDSFEWFGGNVNCSYLVAYRGVDDNWDTDNGYSGKVQFCLGVRDPNLYDVTFAAASNASTSEGFESDNDAGGSNNSPRTSAMFLNVTDIGPFRGTANPASDLLGFRRAGRIRRNSQLSIHNSILMDWRTGLFVDGSGSEGNFISGAARFRNNIIAGVRVDANGRNIVRTNATAIGSWAGITSIDSVANTTGLLVTPYNFTAPDYRPAPGSLALSNYDFSEGTLPVVFGKFEGKTSKNIHFLNWETKSEIDNSGFELERSSDGRNFSSIRFVATKAENGNSNATLSYDFADNRPFPGVSFYRLKQIDKNGLAVYSQVIALHLENVSVLTFGMVYPNPTKGALNLLVIAPAAQNVNFVLTDISGRIIEQRNVNVQKGTNNVLWNVSRLGKGNYFIKALNTEASVQQFNKQ